MTRAAAVLVGLSVAGTLLLAAIYVAAAVPILDDWCFAVRTTSPLETANFLYFDWSGRWPTMFVLAALFKGRAVASPEYAALASLGLLIWYAGFLVVADRALGRGQWPAKLAAAAVLLATFWAASPGTSETFYWVSSFINYGLGFLFGAVCLSQATRDPAAGMTLTVAAVSGFLSSMFSELAGIVLIVALIFLIAQQFALTKRPGSAIIVFAAVALGTALVVLSPGNAARAEIQASMSLPKTIWSVIRPYESPLAIIIDPRILALIAAILVLPKANRQIPQRWWLTPVAAVIAAYAGVLAFVVATGTTPTYRVLSFLQAGVLSAFAVTTWRLRGIFTETRPVFHLAFAALLATAPTVGAALHDLPYAVGQWRQAHIDRWAHLRSSKGRDVALPDFARYPSFYPDRDLNTDPNSGINRCVAQYFAAGSVRSVGPDGKRWRTAY